MTTTLQVRGMEWAERDERQLANSVGIVALHGRVHVSYFTLIRSYLGPVRGLLEKYIRNRLSLGRVLSQNLLDPV